MLSILIGDFSVSKCTRCALVATVKKWLNQHAQCNSENSFVKFVTVNPHWFKGTIVYREIRRPCAQYIPFQHTGYIQTCGILSLQEHPNMTSVILPFCFQNILLWYSTSCHQFQYSKAQIYGLVQIARLLYRVSGHSSYHAMSWHIRPSIP